MFFFKKIFFASSNDWHTKDVIRIICISYGKFGTLFQETIKFIVWKDGIIDYYFYKLSSS